MRLKPYSVAVAGSHGKTYYDLDDCDRAWAFRYGPDRRRWWRCGRFWFERPPWQNDLIIVEADESESFISNVVA